MNPADSYANSTTLRGSKLMHVVALLLADRHRQSLFLKSYACFRWLDDMIDEVNLEDHDRTVFIEGQRDLIQCVDRAEVVDNLRPEEGLSWALPQGDFHAGGGLRSFIQNMFAIIEFDSIRKGQPIGQAELEWYSKSLSRAVVNGLQYFIGNRQ
jgi:hypothetical protein